MTTTPEQVQKLEQAFANGCNITEACLFAGIVRQTFYNYTKENPDFLDKIESLQSTPNLKARLNIIDRVKNGDYEASKWWLERKAKDEFSVRTEQTGKDGKDIMPETIVLRGVRADGNSSS